MQTIWNGFGLPPTNLLWNEVFVPQSTWIVLADIPGIVTRITLPPTTHGVALWTAQAEIWYALDDDPGPIPPPASGTVIGAASFRLGGVLFGSEWHHFTLPDDALPHDVHLVSMEPSPRVVLTAFVEIV
jgi:hypothetical protein